MPGTTYIIRFTHRTPSSGIPYEEQERCLLYTSPSPRDKRQ